MHSTFENSGIKNIPSIHELVKDLSSKNFLLRKKAREELVEIGIPSLDVLVELANSKDLNIRWEAMIAIVQIGSKDSIDILLEALEDDEFSIRWLAAEGLINLGKHAIAPLLWDIIDNPESTFLRRGAHHILKELLKQGLFVDNYKLLETLSNEFDHSKIFLILQKTIDSIQYN